MLIICMLRFASFTVRATFGAIDLRIVDIIVPSVVVLISSLQKVPGTKAGILTL